MHVANARSPVRTGLVLLLIGAAAAAGYAQAADPHARPPADAASAADEQNYIVYELRAGEDPSRVAKMFHVTPDELLALNHITDARRLSVGATLKIPDPRAALVAELRADKQT